MITVQSNWGEIGHSRVASDAHLGGGNGCKGRAGILLVAFLCKGRQLLAGLLLAKGIKAVCAYLSPVVLLAEEGVCWWWRVCSAIARNAKGVKLLLLLLLLLLCCTLHSPNSHMACWPDLYSDCTSDAGTGTPGSSCPTANAQGC